MRTVQMFDVHGKFIKEYSLSDSNAEIPLPAVDGVIVVKIITEEGATSRKILAM